MSFRFPVILTTHTHADWIPSQWGLSPDHNERLGPMKLKVAAVVSQVWRSHVVGTCPNCLLCFLLVLSICLSCITFLLAWACNIFVSLVLCSILCRGGLLYCTAFRDYYLDDLKILPIMLNAVRWPCKLYLVAAACELTYTEAISSSLPRCLFSFWGQLSGNMKLRFAWAIMFPIKQEMWHLKLIISHGMDPRFT
jgi:hypothetical protein